MESSYDKELALFWADGNYGFNKLRAEKEKADKLAAEKRITQIEKDRKYHQELGAALARMEFHPGEWHCGSCQFEYEDGYAGGGVIMDGYCCCRDERIK